MQSGKVWAWKPAQELATRGMGGDPKIEAVRLQTDSKNTSFSSLQKRTEHPLFARFPGYLSKYLDIKFADVPNGLGALSKALPCLK